MLAISKIIEKHFISNVRDLAYVPGVESEKPCQEKRNAEYV